MSICHNLFMHLQPFYFHCRFEYSILTFYHSLDSKKTFETWWWTMMNSRHGSQTWDSCVTDTTPSSSGGVQPRSIFSLLLSNDSRCITQRRPPRQLWSVAATVASAATALEAAVVSENKDDVCEIKSITIKKTLPEFVRTRTWLNSSGTILLGQ